MHEKVGWIKMCNHQYLIEDTSQGNVVCTEYGLVIDKIYCYNLTKSNLETEWDKIKTFDKEIKQKIRAFRERKKYFKNFMQ